MVEGSEDAVLSHHCQPVFVAGKGSQHGKVSENHGVLESLY